jgi:hypothetical protein
MRVSGRDHEIERKPSHFGSYRYSPFGHFSEVLASIVSMGGAKG